MVYTFAWWSQIATERTSSVKKSGNQTCRATCWAVWFGGGGIGPFKTTCFPAYIHKCPLIVKGKRKQTIKILKNISGMHPNPDIFLFQVFLIRACCGGNFRPWKRFAVSDHHCSKRWCFSLSVSTAVNGAVFRTSLGLVWDLVKQKTKKLEWYQKSERHFSEQSRTR